jgi:hypothetical protein
VNRLSLTLGLTAMQTCWVAPWAVLLGLWADAAHPSPLLSSASIFALVLLGALCTQALGRRAARGRGARLAVVGMGVLAVLIAVRLDQYPGSGLVDWLGQLVTSLALVLGQTSAPAFAFGLGLFLWWRGVHLGSQMPTYPDVENAFRWGIGLLVGFALMMALTTRPSNLPALEAQTTPFVVGFFFVSLLTLALGRLESLRSRTRALRVNGQWLGVLIGVAGLIVLVALLLGQLVSFNLLILVTRPLFDLLGWILLVLIYIVVIPLAYVVQLLVYALLSLLRPNAGQKPPEPPQPADIDNVLQRLFNQGVPADLQLVLKAAGATLVLAVALLIIARAVTRWRPASADADATDEERESLWEAGRLRSLLLSWLRNLFRRRAPVSPAAADAPVTTAASLSLSQAVSVRELYRELLRLGESAGAHRALATTPLEHQPALQGTLEPEETVTHLTAAYVEERYADRRSPPATTADLRDALEHVHPREDEAAPR